MFRYNVFMEINIQAFIYTIFKFVVLPFMDIDIYLQFIFVALAAQIFIYSSYLWF